MRRGDLVTIAVSGDYGKPRPALVVQSDLFAELPSLTVLQLTSEIRDEHTIRVSVDPDAGNGLRKRSQVMVDRVMTVPRGKSGAVFGGSILPPWRGSIPPCFASSNLELRHNPTPIS